MHEPGNPLAFIGLLLIKKVVNDNITFHFITYLVWFLQALDI